MVDSVNKSATLLREVARAFVRSQRAAAACCDGRSEAQCHVLGELARSGPLRLTELARRLGADKGWTSRAVASMEGEGLLRRRAGDGDGRSVSVRLTAAGARRWRAMDLALDQHAARMIEAAPSGDHELLARALEVLREALSRSGESRCGRAGSVTERRVRRGRQSAPEGQP